MRRMVRIGLVVLVILAAALVAVLLLRPAASATSSVDADVRVECSGATGTDEAGCRDWGNAILGEGSPTTTFEAQDIVRLRLDRELLGFGASCSAEWYLGRYPNDVAWSETVPCVGE